MWGLLGSRPRTQGWSEWGESGPHRDICLVRWGAWAGARVAWVVRAGPDLGPWTEWSESGEGGGCTDGLAREWSEGGEGGPCTGGLGPVDGARGARSWTCRSASQQASRACARVVRVVRARMASPASGARVARVVVARVSSSRRTSVSGEGGVLQARGRAWPGARGAISRSPRSPSRVEAV